ncbi:MAG: LD-carboxypeptidase [Cyclobacteriaceae bacterium]
MHRRGFISSAALAGGAILAPSTLISEPFESDNLIKPKALDKGDTVGLITPASAISRTAFESSLSNLESLGFKVKHSSNMRVKKGFLAGTDQQRIDDLHSMFEDDAVNGIVCARGGYGSGRLVTQLDYELIKRNPKVFVGYSDITALHYAIHRMTGLVTFHGPVAASSFPKNTEKYFNDIVVKGKDNVKLSSVEPDDKDKAFDHFVINAGEAEGSLVGGNLSLMVSMLGTPYDLDFKDKIVFIEEIGESPYRVDRMLTQLLNCGKLTEAAGIALGVFKGCETRPDDPDFGDSLSLKEVLLDRLKGIGIPMAYGFPIGHIAENATLPMGIPARLDTSKFTLTILEAAVR